jgi:hypothetical protein
VSSQNGVKTVLKKRKIIEETSSKEEEMSERRVK